MTVAASADGTPGVSQAASATAPAGTGSTPTTTLVAVPEKGTVTNIDFHLRCNGRTTLVSTHSQTVGDFLAERHITVGPDDFVSEPLDAPLREGMVLSYQNQKMITIEAAGTTQVIRTTAVSVADALTEAGIAIGPSDDVSPPLHAPLLPYDVIHIERGVASVVHDRLPIAYAVRERDDPHVPVGTERVLFTGRLGERETTTRIVRRADGKLVKTVVGSRIVRFPQARIVERGIASYSSLATIAARGFSSAVHFAGTALHVIATAYTSGCYGCSGITATGLRAGFGIIAVDPNVIPLGTKLFIPGYGPAVAGDTGGAIVGHRVDLGMNSLAEALRFGRRPITVYILR